MYVSKRHHFILDSYVIAIMETDRLQFHLCGLKVMNDQLERIDFISTVLITRYLEKKFKSMINTPCRLLEL